MRCRYLLIRKSEGRRTGGGGVQVISFCLLFECWNVVRAGTVRACLAFAGRDGGESIGFVLIGHHVELKGVLCNRAPFLLMSSVVL
jgi:hypothetical protein